MVLNRKTVGNFTPYHPEQLKAFLKKYYAVDADMLKLYNNALDNTVFDVDNRYILKIYETKKAPMITAAMERYKDFKCYYCIDLCLNKNNEFLSLYDGKPTILYKKAKGKRSVGMNSNLAFLQQFHYFGYCEEKPFHLQTEIDKIKAQIVFYFTPELQEKLKRNSRYYRYKAIFDGLRQIQFADTKICLPFGVVHGDCNPNNILGYQKQRHFIDFDNIGYNYQIYDLVSLLLKYKENPILSSEKNILQKRYFKHNKEDDFRKIYDIINLLGCYKGFEMILSTEYYCFIVKKFSEVVLNRFFLTTLDKLAANVEIRMREIKNARSYSNT